MVTMKTELKLAHPVQTVANFVLILSFASVVHMDITLTTFLAMFLAQNDIFLRKTPEIAQNAPTTASLATQTVLVSPVALRMTSDSLTNKQADVSLSLDILMIYYN